ncbi:uncharacterized protein RCC_08199 [Ramularia collo-cygni]|uniref:Uncharacterized protein n=1 Tax=Ramularia collo-cygni TaxID=112498 RepID=A0A2D3VA42_9PEZI|nr:uncharacterized protein RCC_08199 [Ramularia collo-cygni]CZT22330.1 uncharacterized protein RCC_08199 [Ramularia collo-cygni]
MDSMRHLSTSLPAREPAPAELLPDFKAAAQAVTTLYRNAANSQRHARTAGYQDALDDLLGFLDRSNLGLMDGEGWKVRQWATERLIGDGAATRQQEPLTTNTMTDDEDESEPAKDDDKDDDGRSSSPEIQRKPQLAANSSSDISDVDAIVPRRVVSEPPQQLPYPTAPQKSDFTFQSPHAYPTNHDRDGSHDTEMEIVQPSLSSTTPTASETIRIIPRSNRMTKSHATHSRRTENRSTGTAFSLGQGAGGKRKMPYQEYFDIHGLNDGSDRKDGSGTGRGGKRSRNA